jgi:hypothetical protein
MKSSKYRKIIVRGGIDSTGVSSLLRSYAISIRNLDLGLNARNLLFNIGRRIHWRAVLARGKGGWQPVHEVFKIGRISRLNKISRDAAAREAWTTSFFSRGFATCSGAFLQDTKDRIRGQHTEALRIGKRVFRILILLGGVVEQRRP